MKAIVMTATGGPEVLQLRDLPQPEIETDRQMRVRLRAAGVNPVDTKLRSRGTFYPDRLPAVLGCDGAGIVEETGAAVQQFQPGDEVYFCNGGIGFPQGNYAEYAVIDERFAAAKPASLDFVQAAAAPLVLITAWESLQDRASVNPGDRVLIHAGAGGVGHVAVQLAKAAGGTVCTTVSSEEKERFAYDMGADCVIRYKDRDFVDSVLEWSDSMGVDVALDTVGGTIMERTTAAVRMYGDLVTLLQPPEEMDWKQARLRNLRVSLELMLSPMYFDLHDAREHQARILEQCTDLFDSGQLQIRVAETLPLERAADAHKILESGGMTGKLVLTTD